ncbi:hypothetical protein MXB_2454 [Myxobolus squamalis]|nr:hypothetical protein MXB_2454 [Myxobolus squamalis]
MISYFKTPFHNDYDMTVDNVDKLKEHLFSLQSSTIPIINELESLTLIYEETRNQNINLMQQIHETEATHVKSLTENLKLTQQVKVLNEERDQFVKDISFSNASLNQYTERFSEIDVNVKNLSESLSSCNHESQQRSNLIDLQKRKAHELNQKYVEAQTKVDQLNWLLEIKTGEVAENLSRVENEAFKNRRALEELSVLKRKLDRAHTNQYAGASDRIIIEEIRILKQKLTCNCCNTRPKDAILTKCLHLFCFECLTTTYNSRQRKCPRCGQGFGQNDFHKIYF